MAWLAFEWWAALPTTASVLAELFRPQGKSIEDWVTAVPNGGSWPPIAAGWLKGWGLDLQMFESDRGARNESSYRPTRITGRRSLAVGEAIEFLRELWLAFEPAGTTFAQLDLHLLRASLETVFKGLEGVPPRRKPQEWETTIDAVLADNTEEGDLRDALRQFLLRLDGVSDIPLLRLAADAGTPNDLDHHLRVISRAALLLRVASGCCARLFLRAGVVLTDTRFWWEFLGEDRGLWVPGTPPIPLTALWQDVLDALDDLEDIRTSDPAVESSYYRFLSACSNQILVLAGCERIALWSLET